MSIAVAVYLANLLVSFVYDVIDAESPDFSKSFEMLVLGTLYAITALELALVWLVARGANWSRYVLAAWVVLFNVSYWVISDGLFEPGAHSADTYLILLSTVAQLASAVLLFSKPARPWFQRKTSA